MVLVVAVDGNWVVLFLLAVYWTSVTNSGTMYWPKMLSVVQMIELEHHVTSPADKHYDCDAKII